MMLNKKKSGVMILFRKENGKQDEDIYGYPYV
jgi:hypothetical protein